MKRKTIAEIPERRRKTIAAIPGPETKRKAVAAAVDESAHKCCVCQELLVNEPWVRLHPCGDPMHSACGANWFYTRAKKMDAAMSQQRMRGGGGGGETVAGKEQLCCPLCREAWSVAGAPVLVPAVGASMEVSNMALEEALRELVEEKGELEQWFPEWRRGADRRRGSGGGAGARAGAAPVVGRGGAASVDGAPAAAAPEPAAAVAAAVVQAAPAPAEEEEVEEEEEEEGVDEEATACRLCSQALAGEPWTGLVPCRCGVHVRCMYRHAMSLVSRGGRFPAQLPCPGCRTEVQAPEVWDDFIHVYDVRPVVPEQWRLPSTSSPRTAAAATGRRTSQQVDVNCFWALLLETMTGWRDREVEALLAAEPVPESAVAAAAAAAGAGAITVGDAGREHYQRDDGVDEVVEICFLCRRPLACNYWVCLSCCHHKFHLACLCMAAMEVDARERYIRVCPVCNLALVLNREEVPWFFLWEPFSVAAAGYPSKMQLHEVVFWWYLDLEAHRQELQGSQIFSEPAGEAPDPPHAEPVPLAVAGDRDVPMDHEDDAVADPELVLQCRRHHKSAPAPATAAASCYKHIHPLPIPDAIPPGVASTSRTVRRLSAAAAEFMYRQPRSVVSMAMASSSQVPRSVAIEQDAAAAEFQAAAVRDPVASTSAAAQDWNSAGSNSVDMSLGSGTVTPPEPAAHFCLHQKRKHLQDS